LDDRRHLFLRRYLYALSRAINEAGCDVRGYFYWSLIDNFEWAEVKKKHFLIELCLNHLVFILGF
jgi:beta-glucosidase/6-phospho-beta-glucosidase/beta-galactosidase